MKIRSVTHNNRQKAFEVRTSSKVLLFPYGKADPQPGAGDPIVRVLVDKELGREGFTYTLQSGAEGTVHMEQVLEYNRDRAYLREALVYRLTIEAQKRVGASGSSKRAITRRLGTSASQLYRLLDQKNYRKSVDQMLLLLHILECDVDLVVRPRTSGRRAA